MNDKFWDLRIEKQNRIINAALKIFAAYGYKHAGTDEIAKEAGISKGLLFHYFISKQGLYSFICEYSVQYTKMEYIRSINEKETDFFVLQTQLETAKLQIMRNYPDMNRFLNSVFLEKDQNIINEVAGQMDEYSECLQKLYQKADLSLFKPTVNPSLVLKIILFTIDGLRNEQFQAGINDPDALYQETIQVLKMFRENFYR